MMPHHHRLPSMALLALMLLGGNPIQAEQAKPCSDAPYRAFDFWLGHWDVLTADGKPAGENHISVEQAGCLLIERWRGSGGGTGHSVNFYHPANGSWRQLWVSPGVIIDYSGGLNADGAMRLTGTITYQKDARQAPFRGTWSLQADGTVLQVLEERDSVSGEWNDWFTGIYRRKT